MEEKGIANKVLEFAYLIKYNGEKRDYLEKALKKFLFDPKENFLIEKEIKDIFEDRSFFNKNVDRSFDRFFTTEEIFELQDYITSIDADLEDLLLYLFEKYSNYDQSLQREIGVKATDIIKFSAYLNTIYNLDLIAGDYLPNENVFESKEEAYSPDKLKYPSDKEKEISKMASFITKDALILFLKEGFKDEDLERIIKNIDFLLEIISFDLKKIKEDPKLRFQEKPLYKVDSENYILLNAQHLLSGLPSRLDELLNNYPWYRNRKGKDFENFAFKILNEINSKKRIGGTFSSEIKYSTGDKIYDLDGLINFDDFSWFIELKGRIPRSKTFKGDSSSVNKDLKRAIKEAEDQAIRAINEAERKGKIGDKTVNEIKGILIITEGMYPNLNQNTALNFERKDNRYPRYIMNFLTFMEILRQRDVYYLKQFLEWRTDPKMPLHCYSELDYWDYFTRMQEGLDKKESYNLAKERNQKLVFIGRRFNAPKYIRGDE